MASLVDPLLPLSERMPGLPQEAGAASGADPMPPAPYRIHQQRQELSDAFILELRPADGSTGAPFPPGQFNRRCAFGLGEVPISISDNPAQPAALEPDTKVMQSHLGLVTTLVSVVNPKYVKDFAGSFGLPIKHDRHNARVLARFGRERQPHPWQPPASFSPHLHALLKRLEAVEQDLKRKLNRQEHAEAGQVPAAVHASLTRVITALEQERDRLRRGIEEHIQQHPALQAERARLESMPGIGSANSALLVALFQGGQRFTSAAQAAAYVGLIPTTYESGTSVRKPPHLSLRGMPR